MKLFDLLVLLLELTECVEILLFDIMDKFLLILLKLLLGQSFN